MQKVITNNLSGIFLLALVLLTVITLCGTRVPAQVSSGIVISNQAHATYTDETKKEYTAISQIVSVTVTSVHRLEVTPDETSPSAATSPKTKILRTFTITNSGNTADSFIVSSVSATSPADITGIYFDVDKSHTITEADQSIQLNSTISPVVAPRSSIDVLVVIKTNDLPSQSLLNIDLTAKSAGDSTRQDVGKIINNVVSKSKIVSPNDPNAAPLKLINGQKSIIADNGQVVTYDISFQVDGTITAEQVIVRDKLPDGAKYVPGSLQLNNQPLTDGDDGDKGTVNNQTVEVRPGNLASKDVIHITFQAQINSSQNNTSIENTAVISGNNFDEVNSNPAVAVVHPYATVFAGHSGGSVPVAGARLTLHKTGDPTPIDLPDDLGVSPNPHNDNTFVTNSDGYFNFMLSEEQTGTGSSTGDASYILTIQAPGYQERQISIVVWPDPDSSGLKKILISSLDRQPLAKAHGFTLTQQEVEINDLAALAFDIPLFETSDLAIQKSADRATAEIGDIVNYQVTVQNSTPTVVNQLAISDQLPVGFIYIPGTGQIQDKTGALRQIEPETTADNLLIFKLPSLDIDSRAIFFYRVRVGANARTGVNINTAGVSGFYPNGDPVQTPAAQASVRISNGAFSTQQIVIGRVFDDKNGNHIFDKNDVPVAGARIYTNKGQFVVTDSAGMYNLPLVEDGALVLELDPLTLPDGLMLEKSSRRDNQGFERLLRTPLLGGSMLRQNFALTADTSKQVKKSEFAKISDKATDQADKTALSANNGTSVPATTGQSGTEKSPESSQPAASDKTKAGTYEEVSSEKIDPVAPGVIEIISPRENQVIMSPALELEARVATDWKIQLLVNGALIGKENIGVYKQFHESKVDAFKFVGIGLKPGVNTIVATAVSPDGREGQRKEISVMGRGPAKRLEIATEVGQLKANGKDETLVSIKAFDEWNNPAVDNQVALTVSQGNILLPGENPVKSDISKISMPDIKDVNANNQAAPVNQNQQRVISLENGVGIARIAAGNQPGTAEIKAETNKTEAKQTIHYVPDLRPSLIVGLAEASFGRAAPNMTLRGIDSQFHSRVGFYYSGRLFSKNLLTVAYDSERALNRSNGRDRLFEQDPLNNVYPVFGDSSTRFENAVSNSKLYARIDRGLSYAMFGDYETEMTQLSLAGYSRKLNGVKLHVANTKGDFISVTGARPNTSFTRDTFPGNQLGLVRLSQTDILQGSETVILETRDRRNPEIVISRQQLVRSVDYNLDILSGQIYFLRPLMAFDFDLNLVQVVVTYEHFTSQNDSNVYTGRALKQFNRFGLKLGLTFIDQKQDDFGSFIIGGLDGEKSTFNGGKVRFEYAMSNGVFAAEGNTFSSNNLSAEEQSRHNGNAFQIEYEQPINYKKALLKAKFARADADFYNPFGTSVAPGSQRAAVELEMSPRASSRLRLGFMDEQNQTENVDNQRSTVSTEWTEQVRNNLRLSFGYNFRQYTDAQNENNDVTSNLITVGAEWKPTEKLQFNIKREQNLGDADPTYPDQTTLAAKYQVNNLTNIFFTQRLASDAIRPISDISTIGFASSTARHETAFGVETKLWRYSTFSSRYQVENGINGTDSFAIIGLQNSLPINKKSSLEFGYERGFLITGKDRSFNSALIGYSWKNDNFRSSIRYELRDRTGLSHILTGGVAGKLGDNITVLGRLQFAGGNTGSSYTTGTTNIGEQQSRAMQGTAALALRPLKTDRVALLFSYNLRSNSLYDRQTLERTTDRSDTFATDGLWQASHRLEFYGHGALKFEANGRPGLITASTLTYLLQGRAQYKLWDNWDVAIESRYLTQPASKTARVSTGLELGYWVLPDIRLGGGYNLSKAYQFSNYTPSEFQKSGFYFNVTTKLSRVFNLFGSSKNDKNEPETRKPEISVVDKKQ